MHLKQSAPMQLLSSSAFYCKITALLQWHFHHSEPVCSMKSTVKQNGLYLQLTMSMHLRSQIFTLEWGLPKQACISLLVTVPMSWPLLSNSAYMMVTCVLTFMKLCQVVNSFWANIQVLATYQPFSTTQTFCLTCTVIWQVCHTSFDQQSRELMF